MTIKDLFYNGLLEGTISLVPIPDYFETSLSKRLRPYQQECFRNFLMYMGNDFDGKQERPHLLFHMATGSGKTLIMAGAMLYLYEQGYRNFLFFVDSTNIVEKTKDNFLNPSSSKYLFAPQIIVNGNRVEVRKVDNFQGAATDCINLCLCTIQGLHSDLNSEKENAVTYDDFADQPIVLISDEAHHMNAATRRGGVNPEDEQHTKDWESTVMRILNKDNGTLPNVLLDFTATADLTDPLIAQKYEDKVIFDYPLKKFREDLYSKDVEVVESDLEPLDMALQAMILSQYKRKLFADIKQNIKPVVLLKSKTIGANKDIFDQFKQALLNFDISGVDRIRARAKDDLAAAFDYFDEHHISTSNLILELQEDFTEERLLLVDGNNISSEKQLLLNSLEDADNEIRAIFAVDMLNEGWDVLNLYDIVRLYNTRDAANNRPGKTTMQEAQLIGRGARYMPFVDPNNPALDADKRKYDGDATNPLRVIEKLHYHSTYNPRYIQELHTALVETGIIPDTKIQLDLFLKQDFKESRLYEKGLVFLNRRIPLSEAEDDGSIGKSILQKTFSVSVHTGQMRTNQVFSDNTETTIISTKILPSKFKDIDYHVVRSAMNSFASFSFDRLKKLYPQLKSSREFITSDNYLANLDIRISGTKNSIADYSQSDKLMIAKTVFKEIEPLLLIRGKSYKGTHEFKPFHIKDKFRDVIQLNVTIPKDGNQEFGVSMRTPRNPKYALDLSTVKWYAYNDNYGTSEEKALVKYIEAIMPKLEEKYDEIYLVRNEKDIQIFSFDTGQAFEPDFVLFLRIKGTSDKYDNLQLFIEPKGDGLLKQDKWKNDFLKQIKQTAEIHYCTSVDNYLVWGIPFFNEAYNSDFDASFNEEVLKYTPTSTPKTFVILSNSEVPKKKKFVQFLPVYSVRAACGSFEDNAFIPENEAEGWIEITETCVNINENMFIVHAIGDSMSPLIKDGDLCLFELYNTESCADRESNIVLTQCSSKDGDYDCSYTIKKYHSEKSINEDGTWQHTKVELISLNPDYDTIELDKKGDYKTVGIFRGVL
jgi:type III restriction enzyme